jgi:hypothetical protein
MSYNLLNDEYIYLSKIKDDKYNINHYVFSKNIEGKTILKIDYKYFSVIKILLQQYTLKNNNDKLYIYCHKIILLDILNYVINNKISDIDKNDLFKNIYEYILNKICKKYKYNSNKRCIKKIINSINNINNYEIKYYILLSLYEKFIIKTYIDKSKIPIRNKLCKKIDNNDNIIKDTINVFTLKHINFIYE